MKQCSVCKVHKMNHLEKECNNKNPGNDNSSTFGLIHDSQKDLSHGDSIRHQMHKLAPRDVIEQIIFDPKHGIVKREIHFGIIDYLTNQNLKKQLEVLSQKANPSLEIKTQVVPPKQYSERFLTTMRKIFE